MYVVLLFYLMGISKFVFFHGRWLAETGKMLFGFYILFTFFFVHATMVHVQGVRSCVGSLVVRESTESFLWANVSM